MKYLFASILIVSWFCATLFLVFTVIGLLVLLIRGEEWFCLVKSLIKTFEE